LVGFFSDEATWAFAKSSVHIFGAATVAGRLPIPAESARASVFRPKTVRPTRPGHSEGATKAENHHRGKLFGNTADCACATTRQMAKGGGKDKARKRHDRAEAHRAKLAAKEQRRAAKGSKKKDAP